MINPNIKNISEPPIPLALSWSKSYNGEYGDIIDMSQAVPSYPPHPLLMKNFLNSATDKNLLSYGEIEGEKVLRENYSKHINEKYKATTNYKQILITSGCNQAFIASVICLAQSGDEIMISNPGYFSHELSLKMLQVKPRYFDLNQENNFEIDLDDIENKINPKVKAIVLVSPSNPTGSPHRKELINKVMILCKKKNIYLILDETYRDFIYPENGSPHDLFKNNNWSSNFIQLYSFSKSCCIPGHRLGAITADTFVISQISKVMDNIQICAPRPAQVAVANFLPELKNFMPEKAKSIGKKAVLFSEKMSLAKSWEISSIGSFFAYVRHPYKSYNCSEIAKTLAINFGVVSIPGSYFGNNQELYLRMSIAGLSNIEIEDVPNRLNEIGQYLSI